MGPSLRGCPDQSALIAKRIRPRCHLNPGASRVPPPGGVSPIAPRATGRHRREERQEEPPLVVVQPAERLGGCQLVVQGAREIGGEAGEVVDGGGKGFTSIGEKARWEQGRV